MARKYKLRLRDGTLLVVDYAGLRTWLLDDQAAVQPPGSRGWRRLAQFLAEEPPDEPAPTPARESIPAPVAPARGNLPVLPAEIAPEEPSPIALVPLAEDVSPPRPTAARAARPSSPDPLDLAGVARSALTAPIAESVRAPSAASNDAIPIIPLKPLEEDEREDQLEELDLLDDVSPRIQAPKARAAAVASPVSGWLHRAKDALRLLLDSVLAYLRRVAERQRTKPPPARPRTASSARREAVQPPPPISELPVLRFAPLKEEPETGDIFDGPVGSRRPARRAALVGAWGVVGGSVVVALSWWLSSPTTPDGSAGSAAPLVRPSLPPAEPARVISPRDVRAVAARLPHLPPETIELVMSSADLAPDPVQVFRRAQEALNRGRPALRGYDAQELWRLEQAAMATLRPADQQRVRAYERQRSGNDVATSEDARVLALVARASQALPPQNRLRYRTLLGRAVIAGLTPPGRPGGGDR